MAIYTLKYLFDSGSGVCLWSTNAAANERFDYPVLTERLPLPDDVRERVERMIDWYDTGLDWDDPAGPSPWTDEEQARFNAEARAVLAILRAHLAPDFEIEDRSRTAGDAASA